MRHGLNRKLVVALLVGTMTAAACTFDEGASPSVSLDGRLPVPSGVKRPAFEPANQTDGRWAGISLQAAAKVRTITSVGDGPMALAIGGPKQKGEFQLYASHGGDWVAATDWAAHPDAARRHQGWVSLVAVDEGQTAVVVGHLKGRSGPISAAIGPNRDPTFSPLPPAGGRTIIDAALSDGTTALVVGRLGAAPTMWRTSDGLAWTEVSLPISWEKGGFLIDGTHLDGTWAIAAFSRSAPRELVVLTSLDTIVWETHSVDPPANTDDTQLVSVGHDGSHFVLLGVAAQGNNRLTHDVTWSSPNGRDWGPPSDPDAAVFGDGRVRVREASTSADATVLAGRSFYHLDPNYCFDDAMTCDTDFEAVWLAKDGGWHLLALPSSTRATAAAVLDGVLYIGGKDKNGAVVHHWLPDTDGEMPLAEPLGADPPESDLLHAQWGQTLLDNVVYGWPTGPTICAFFNDTQWVADTITPDAAAIIEAGEALAGSTVYGTIELIASDRIEYAIPGEGPIGYLSPAPPGDGHLGLLGCL